MEKGGDHTIVHQNSNIDDVPKQVGNVKEANVASVALAAAVEAQKPKLLSPNMIKLYMIMAIGYLVSTMNGFGEHLATFVSCAISFFTRLLAYGCHQRNACIPEDFRLKR
jgi:hypothetical protein